MNNLNNINNFDFNNENNMNNKINSPNLQQNIKNNNLGNYETLKIKEQSKYNLIYPHRTGLENIGHSCMNSTIQCLSNIKYLSDYLIKHYGKFDVNNQPLSVAFSSLVYDLFTTQKKYIAPKLFKKIIGKLNPLFEGNQEVDAKELIIFLLGKLHQELNKCTSEKPKIDYDQLENDSFDENKMLQHFIKDYTGKNRSIISDTFYGIIRSTMKCNNCKMIKYSFKTFNFLIFKLKNVKEFIQKLMYNKNKYTLNIYDAFDCNRKEELLDGDNKNYCNFCKNLTICAHQQFIYSLPKVLIIILDRGRNNQDFKEEFIFPKELDLSIENYVILKNGINTKFYLQSVITHLGDDVTSGHFITYCRNGPNEDFLRYNDIAVSKVNMNEVMSSNFSKFGKEKRAPYILVYHSLE
jgi:ubiquitin C-terminal hydrolase